MKLLYSTKLRRARARRRRLMPFGSGLSGCCHGLRAPTRGATVRAGAVGGRGAGLSHAELALVYFHLRKCAYLIHLLRREVVSPVAWEEALVTGAAQPAMTLQLWTPRKEVRWTNATKLGFHVLRSDFNVFYLDYDNRGTAEKMWYPNPNPNANPNPKP